MCFINKHRIACLLIACFVCNVASGANNNPSSDNKTPLQASVKDMQWWRDAKFGLFVHWGPVSLKGTEIGWSRAGERRGHKNHGTEVPVEIYDNLYKQFNPTKYNPDEWVNIAKAAGMKYIILTSKHHDGFCMFDSKLTDYKITNSPYNKDICAELADACHRGGIKLGWYYSPVDWYDADYRTERHEKYIQYMHGQLRELCSNYGPIDIIWFDGLGGTAKDWDAETMIGDIRRRQPGIIINNRAGLDADYSTPEQRVGSFRTDRAWETCMTICKQWAWKPNDKLKSLKECIDILVKTVGGDGNLLLNVGPMPTGEIEPRQVDRLKEIGRWLTTYGPSIYKTRGGPFKPGLWGVSTHQDNKIYIHVLHFDSDRITLPPIKSKIVKSELMTGGMVKVTQSAKGIEISVPPDHRKELDTVIVLTLDGPAADAQPAPARSGSVATGKKVTASGVRYNENNNYGAWRAADDDLSTSWIHGRSEDTPWIEIDLGKETTICRAFISEASDNAQVFELKCKKDDQWQTITKGTAIGRKLDIEFAPVEARYVRLTIKCKHAPHIAELQLFACEK